MKCDLSEVWKLALSHKDWKDTQAIDKKFLEAANTRLADEVEQLTTAGWHFKRNEFVHPHNSDTIREDLFKSPRMLHYRWYDIHTDFKLEEAKSLAHSHRPTILPIAQELIESELTNFFYYYPNETKAPKLVIQITDVIPCNQ